MSIKRISELPRIQDEEISSALIEFSVSPSGEKYESRCGSISSICNTVINRINESELDNVTISGDLSVEAGDVSFNADDDSYEERRFSGKFGDISLCANGDNTGTITLKASNGIYLESNPVVIASNLSVWNYNTRSDRQVILSSGSNDIYVKNLPVGWENNDNNVLNVNQAVNYHDLSVGIMKPKDNLKTILGNNTSKNSLNPIVNEISTFVSSLYDWIYKKAHAIDETIPQYTGKRTIDNISTYLDQCGFGGEKKDEQPSCFTYQMKVVNDTKYKYHGKIIPTLKVTGYCSYITKEGVTDVWMPGVKEVTSTAFSGFKNLSSITLNDLSSIGKNGIFKGCESLESVSLPNLVAISAKNPLFDIKCKNISELNAPVLSSITGKNTFYRSPIKKVTVKSLTNIPTAAFRQCSAFTDLVFKESNQKCTVELSAFAGCSALKSLSFTLNGSVSKSAFYGCSSLISVDLSLVSFVAISAFTNCTSLETIDMSQSTSSLKIAGTNVFSKCKNVKTVKLPNYDSGEYQTVFNNILKRLPKSSLKCEKYTLYCTSGMKNYLKDKQSGFITTNINNIEPYS